MGVRLGFVGVGDMGASMAARALASGAQVWVYDVNPAAVEQLVSAGAQPAGDLEALCRQVDQVHVVVNTAAQLNSVFGVGTDEPGLLHVAPRGQCLLVHSTVHPETCRTLAGLCAERGLRFLDAPVSGSTAKSHGEGGTLVTFVGAEAADLEAARAGLDAFVTTVFHVGGVGSGQLIKLANNLVAITNSVVLGEGVRLAALAGVDATEFIGLIKHAAGDSWAAEHGFASRVWRGLADPESYSTGKAGFTQMLQKDLGLALQVGLDAGLDLPVLTTSVESLPTLLG